MKSASRFKFFLIQIVRIIIIAIALGYVISISPVLQEEQSSAPIILNGQKVFEIGPSEEMTAQKRAEDINLILKDNLKDITSTTVVRVNIDSSEDLPAIRINREHLLSVTETDVPPGRTTLEQAENWAKQLEENIQRFQEERTTKYLTRASFILALVLSLAIFLSWIIGWFWSRKIKPWLWRGSTVNQESSVSSTRQSIEVIATTFLNFIRAIIWLVALIYISGLFPQTRQGRSSFTYFSLDLVNVFINSLTSDIFPLGDKAYSILDFFILIGLFIGLIFTARTIKTILRSRVLSFTGLSRSAQETIIIIANYTFIFIGTVVLLQLWGLDLSSLTVFAGVLGVGVGLGIQGIAKEFVSGLVLIFERPIQVGEFVKVGELVGTVERISVRSTEIITPDRVSVIIPNSRFLEEEVVNWNHGNPTSRLQIPVEVAEDSNVSLVQSLLLQVATQHQDVLKEPKPKVWFEGFGENALVFKLLLWIEEPDKQFDIKSDMYFLIEEALRQNQIKIPIDQRDLNFLSGSLPIEISPEIVSSLAKLSDSLSLWLSQQNNK
ncbi:MAG: mechanosensitive ion channel domain-containing protein [Spirulinaceae cyanobacterium]